MEKPNFDKWIHRPLFARSYLWQALACFALLVCGIVVLVLLTGNVNGWHRAVATVSGTENGLVVTYNTAEGTIVDAPLLYGDRNWQEGRSVWVRYRVDDPNTVQSYRHYIWMGVCLLAAGIIVGLLALLGFGEDRKRTARLQAVAERGQPVEAQVVSVYNDMVGLTRRSRQAYCRLDCYYTPTAEQAIEGDGGVWIFTSERFANPHQRFTGTVTVYVTLDDPNNYYVDLTTLRVETVEEDAQDTSI